MIYGYLRVSTDSQDVENQKSGIVNFAKNKGMVIQAWVTDDGVSGTKEPEKRLLGKLLKKMKSGDTIIASEISRLGRSLFMVIRILEHCMKSQVSVLTVKDGYELGDNITSKVLAFAFGLAAEIERDMISKRTKEALQRKRSEGVVLGRPLGSKSSRNKLTDKAQKIIKLYSQDLLSLAAIARMLKVNRMTVSKFITDHNVPRRTHAGTSNLPNKSHFKGNVIVISKEEFLLEYQKTHSISSTAKVFDCSSSGLNSWIRKQGLREEIEAMSKNQRSLHKSKRQIIRDEVNMLESITVL